MKRIAIVCGGDSSEYGVSMRSGAGLYSFFDKEKYDVKLVEIKGLDWEVHLDENEDENENGNGKRARIDLNDFSYMVDGVKCGFDYVYITIHGAPGENGVLQGYFELIGMPYSTSGVLVEALTFDKFALNNYLRGFGVNVAKSILLRKGDANRPSDEQIAKELGLPCFIKPTADGSSFGVSKVKTLEDVAPALEVAFAQNDEVMVEAFMDGVELAQGCFHANGKTTVLPATEIVSENEFFDYDAKYKGQVNEITPARLSPETAARVAAETERIYNILHCNGIARVDYIITKDADGNDFINMLEMNTTPGMTATSLIPQQVRAAGLDIKDVLSAIVEEQIG